MSDNTVWDRLREIPGMIEVSDRHLLCEAAERGAELESAGRILGETVLAKDKRIAELEARNRYARQEGKRLLAEKRALETLLREAPEPNYRFDPETRRYYMVKPIGVINQDEQYAKWHNRAQEALK